MISINTNGATTEDFATIDAIIALETKRKINRVMDADKYGITVACVIDGDFRLESRDEVPEDMFSKLRSA